MSHVTTAERPAAAASLAAAPQETPAQLPRTVQPPLAGGGRILPIVPQNLAEVRLIAEMIARGGAAPESYRSDNGAGSIDVEMVCAAILVGLEVGLPPTKAVAGIVMFDDGPAIWGDARDGLVAASGLLDDMKEEMVVDPDDGIFISATCTVWRKGRPTPTTQTVTRGQVALAGWFENDGWKTNPNRMAQIRARGWANHDAFPDVLTGLRAQEERQDYIDVTRRGSATTAPPEPKRSDFMAPAAQREERRDTGAGAASDERQHDPVADNQPEEPEGWPLYDETGETVDTYPAVRWVDEFERMVSKLDGARMTAAIDHNRDTAAKVVAEHADDLGPIVAAGLSASFAFVEVIARRDGDRDEASEGDLIPAGTQEECAAKLVALIEASFTVSRVNRIVRVNIDRVKSWSEPNRDRVSDAQDARIEHLQSGGGH